MSESDSDSDVDWSFIGSQEEGLDARSSSSTAFDVESRMSRSLDLGLGDVDHSEHFGAVSPSHRSLECSGLGTSAFEQPRTKCKGTATPAHHQPGTGSEAAGYSHNSAPLALGPGTSTCNTNGCTAAVASPELNQGDKIATRIKSVWHNMKFGKQARYVSGV